jgi:two-component system C4-dicarboxylate transport response regulator DctD
MAPAITDPSAAQKIQFVPRGRVLLVDEQPGDLEDCRATLQAQRFEVRTCCSYAEGLRCLDTEVFDFLIVSQGSHAFEGRCVLEHAVEIDRGLPALVVARHHDMGCYLEAMQLGAVDYVEKPLSAAEMVRMVETHLRRYGPAA